MLFSHKPKNLIVLIIDIQSSIVRSALVDLVEGSAPYIFYSYSKPIAYVPNIDTNHLVKITLKATEEAVDSAVQFYKAELHHSPNFPRHISRVHYVLSSPWIVSKAKTISLSFTKSTSINRDFVTKLVSEERQQEFKNLSTDIETIEEKVFDININGYSIDNWENKDATKISVSFATSFAGTGMVERFSEISTKIAHNKNIFFHSSLLLQYLGIRIILPKEKNYMLVHIHGELTDIVIVEQGICVFFGSFPKGTNSIVRSVAKIMKVSPTVADSFLTLYVGNKIEAEYSEDATKVIGDISEGWCRELTKLLESRGNDRPLPPSVILSSKVHEDYFTQIFADSHPEMKIRNLTVDDMKQNVTFASKVETLRLTGTYAIAIKGIEEM